MSDYYIIAKGSDYPEKYCPSIKFVGEAILQLSEQHPDKIFTRIRCDDWFKKKENEYISKPISEISEEQYLYALNCLPPLNWCHHNGVEIFNMSEFQFGRVTTQYAKHQGQYYLKYVVHNDKNTYFSTEVIQNFNQMQNAN
jgi:hypothetical protein